VKVCVACKKEKSLDEFSPDKRHADGKMSQCRDCRRIYTRGWARDHRNPERDRAACRRWREKNPDKVLANNVRWRKEKPEILREASRKWKLTNPEKNRVCTQKWNAENVERRRWHRRKLRSTLRGRLNSNISTAICNSLKGRKKTGRHWEGLVGFTLEQVKSGLERQFTGGMTWENYGLWHIDHKIPITAFNFDNPEDYDFRRCWALSNLQPLWAKENMSKKDKVEIPFQPALSF
jgi:hypothetical protein